MEAPAKVHCLGLRSADVTFGAFPASRLVPALELGSIRESDPLLLLTSLQVQGLGKRVSTRGRLRRKRHFAFWRMFKAAKQVPFQLRTRGGGMAVSHARHPLREEPFKAGVCQPCHPSIFPG